MTHNFTGFSGRDVLDVLSFVESKHPGTNEMLTLLSSAIALVALHEGIKKKDLMRGVEGAYMRTREIAQNTAQRGDTRTQGES